ncbi:MAG: protein-L-isoaspartate O-methyltransferase [Anaerolineaceae bacterium]|nr:protein-L-isoaspartate(D-aspartate) O-methyltransferase [Anaerolineae bacterium]MDL1926665.1 protein-L-isoaspartate(D-aspartate) O-methyltransferase [Anaerolineae bacterium AMX1]WKZ53313.1 MAG: protein-L-isoaspartate(D-aspartate) O-methyltransferase [Anaerolineales bacterium]GIK08458.1 MAG: protein-L-isoaspartate O-methyltransferase [Chloroflexota bacterium]GJQ38392.1 MAG: protein-L-isoaspartate O-methyltransferase [Anaerolineaceae bacterium]
MDAYESDRKEMTRRQIAARGLRDPRLLAAFESVPRHLFVPEEYRQRSYADGPLPIGHEQTISQPYIVALMTHLLELTGRERVLEVGTGSGYQAAILSRLAAEVHTVEIVPELFAQAERTLSELGCANVHSHLADGSLGWTAAAPYDGILVTAAAPSAPQMLLDQLAAGGRLVLPVGGLGYQELEIWRKENEEFKRKSSLGVAFVPLRGEYGWK